MRTKKRQERRRQILDGARQVFIDKGFAAATMQQVADGCRVGKGTLYEYFDSKEDLFIEACLSGFATGAEEIAETFRRGPPREALGQVLDALLDEVPDLLEKMPLYFTLWGRLSFDARYRKKCHEGFRDLYRDSRAAISAGIAAAREAGEVRSDLSPDDVATFIIALVDGYLYQCVFAREDIDVERFRSTLRKLVLGGLSPSATPGSSPCE